MLFVLFLSYSESNANKNKPTKKTKTAEYQQIKHLLKTKLYAYCDRDIDLQDCIELKPTVKELDNALNWLIERDSNPLWPNRVKEQVIFLKEKLNG